MGVIKRGILGGFSGKVANVVGAAWKGIAYMRSLPLSVANPKTAGQVAQRTAFSTIVDIASILLVSTIKPLWDRFAQRMSGFNHFVQQNIAEVSGAGVVTYANLKMSIGSLLGAAITSADASNGQVGFIINFLDNSGTGSAIATDATFGVAYNETQDKWAQGTGDDRSAESQSVNFADAMVTGDVMHGWLCFRRPDGTIVSDSSYITTVVVV